MEYWSLVIESLIRLVEILAWPFVIIYTVRKFNIPIAKALENLASRVRSIRTRSGEVEFERVEIELMPLGLLDEKELPPEDAEQN